MQARNEMALAAIESCVGPFVSYEFLPLRGESSSSLLHVKATDSAETIHQFVFKSVTASEVIATQLAGEAPERFCVPKPLATYLDESNAIDLGKSWILMPFLNGRTLTFDDDIPNAIVQALAKLHASFNVASQNIGWTWTFDRQHMQRTLNNAISELNECAEHDLAKQLEALSATGILQAETDNLPRVLCHGDMHPGNIMAAHDGRFWLIDWGNACAAPPTLDIANIVKVDSKNWIDYIQTLKEQGFNASKDTLERSYYWARAATGLQYLPWIVKNTTKGASMVDQVVASAKTLTAF